MAEQREDLVSIRDSDNGSQLGEVGRLENLELERGEEEGERQKGGAGLEDILWNLSQMEKDKGSRERLCAKRTYV
jgi:hypothetical protein